VFHITIALNALFLTDRQTDGRIALSLIFCYAVSVFMRFRHKLKNLIIGVIRKNILKSQKLPVPDLWQPQ